MGETSSADRVPPHSQEAEVAVLGAIMLDPKAMGTVAPVLQAECFYRADHQKLYGAFLDLYARNEPIDVLSVKEELRRRGATDIAANADLFVTLGNAVPSVANAEYYADVVRRKFLLRSLIAACNESLVEAYDERQESDAILDRAEQRVFGVATRYESSHPVEIKEVVNAVLDTLVHHPERLLGTFTEYGDLDRMTSGLHRGELVIIGGRPSSGKTTFALNLIRNIAVRQTLPVLLFSLEMPKEQITQNLLCCQAKVDSTALRAGKLDKTQWERIKEAASELFDSPVFIDDSSALTCTELRAKCRRMFAQHEIRLVVVDYLQLMSGERRGREVTRLQEITDISRGLKALAKDLNVPVVALSQLSRAAESDREARPRMSHLRESGAIEQDADLIILLYRDESAHPEAAQPAPTELIVAKQRNGPTGTVNLSFVKEQMRFEPFSAYTPPPEVAQDDEVDQPF